MKQFDSMVFRKTRLWREEIDVLYTRLLTGLQLVFSKNAGKLATPGMNRVPMSLDEFMTMFTNAGLIDDSFG